MGHTSILMRFFLILEGALFSGDNTKSGLNFSNVY